MNASPASAQVRLGDDLHRSGLSASSMRPTLAREHRRENPLADRVDHAVRDVLRVAHDRALDVGIGRATSSSPPQQTKNPPLAVSARIFAAQRALRASDVGAFAGAISLCERRLSAPLLNFVLSRTIHWRCPKSARRAHGRAAAPHPRSRSRPRPRCLRSPRWVVACSQHRAAGVRLRERAEAHARHSRAKTRI